MQSLLLMKQNINIAMPMYNLTEYSYNYSDTSENLWQFKRDEIEGDVDLTVNGNPFPNNSSLFKQTLSIITYRWSKMVSLYQQKTMQNYQNY